MTPLRRAAIRLATLFALLGVYWIWTIGPEGCARHRVVPLKVLEEFGEYPLEKQIAIVEEYSPEYTTAWWMMSQISRHGEAAYKAMLPYLKGDKKGIEPGCAARAMEYIHGRGFNLKGSEAEALVEKLSLDPDDPGWVGANSARIEISHRPPGRMATVLDLMDQSFLRERRRVR